MIQQADTLKINPLQEYQHLMISQVPDTCPGFFQNNPLLHSKLFSQPTGLSADPLPQQLWQTDWVAGVLLACFIIIVYIFSQAHKTLKFQGHAFFFPPQATRHGQPQPHLELHTVLLTHIALTLSTALLYFAFVQARINLFLLSITPLQLYFVYAGLIAGYFLFKHTCSACINHVFFTEAQRIRWYDASTLLLCAEALCAFFLSIAITFSCYAPVHILTIALGGLALAKLLLAFKCLTIFFNHIYLFLHLFVYLCTLEIAPLFALWKILANITNN